MCAITKNKNNSSNHSVLLYKVLQHDYSESERKEEGGKPNDNHSTCMASSPLEFPPSRAL